MVLFRPDGKYAFVPSSFTPEMDVIDTADYQVIARVSQASPFSPNLAVDEDDVWFTLKDTGKTQIVSAKPPFRTLATLETGPITNHVTFVRNALGRFAYVSVGGKDQVLVYRRDQFSPPKLFATIKAGDLPHGIWGRAMEVASMSGWKMAMPYKLLIRQPTRSSRQFQSASCPRRSCMCRTRRVR